MSVSVLNSACAALAVLALSAVSVAAQDVGRMEQVVRASAEDGGFSGSVLVARGDQVLFEGGYGLADREWNAPNDGDTKFRLASVSKQFTAVAVLMLHQRGRIDLDAPVKTYLPEAPAAWDAITVRRLLTHTSGLPDFTRDPDYADFKTRPATPDSLMARFRDRPLAFAPGERFAYSNSGYVVLTAVIEAASGETYADFVEQKLMRPLGMADSGYDRNAVVLPRRASGYVSGDGSGAGGVVRADYVDMSVPQGAGGLYSTTHDLLKWEQGLFGGRLLSPTSLEALTTPYLDDYALGLEVKTEDGERIASHSGGIEGFNTYLGRDLDQELTVVVLGNLNGAAPEKLGQALMTLARGGTVTLHGEHQAVVLSPEALRSYVGDYALAPGFTLTVALGETGLTAQATGQSPLDLFAEGEDAFFLKAMDAQIIFERDADGVVQALVLNQGGRQMRAPRT